MQSVHYAELTRLKETYNYKSFNDLIKDLLVDAKDRLTVQKRVIVKSNKAVEYKSKLDIKAAKRAFYQKRMEEYWSDK